MKPQSSHPLKWLNIRPTITSLRKDKEQWDSDNPNGWHAEWCNHLVKSVVFLNKISKLLPYEQAVSSLSIYAGKIEPYIHKMI